MKDKKLYIQNDNIIIPDWIEELTLEELEVEIKKLKEQIKAKKHPTK